MPTYLPVPVNKRCPVNDCHGRLDLCSRRKEALAGVYQCIKCDRKYQNQMKSTAPRHRGTSHHRPMTVSERVQAVIRHPEYIRQAEAFRRTIVQDQTSAALTHNPVDGRWAVPAGTIFSVGTERLSQLPHLLKSFDPPLAHLLAKGFADGYARRLMVKDIREARYLVLEIDLTIPAHESVRIAQDEIKHYQRLIGVKPIQRNKPTKVDPWGVYDLHVYAKLSLVKISRMLFQVKGNPAIDPEVAKRLKLVERAYQKAAAMVAAVKPGS